MEFLVEAGSRAVVGALLRSGHGRPVSRGGREDVMALSTGAALALVICTTGADSAYRTVPV